MIELRWKEINFSVCPAHAVCLDDGSMAVLQYREGYHAADDMPLRWTNWTDVEVTDE